jgi:putative transposase
LRYLEAFRVIEGLKGETAIQEALDKAGIELDYKSVMRARAHYREEGITALIGKYGKRKGTSILDDEKRFGKGIREVYVFFKSLYLKEGAPSLQACYAAVLGFAKERGYEQVIQRGDFPSPDTFYDKIHNELGESAIYLHRYGQAAWNRKYAAFAHRDYAKVKAGAVWVSDHRQIDQLWIMPDGTQKRVWITVWRDFKTAKWLSWLLHVEAPNSEHVFETFCQAVAKWGVPEEILIDNGKDYRVYDFAGGRKVHRVEVDTGRARSLTALLGIRVHFSAPYNAQAKPIERDFLLFKEWCDKMSGGYFGGNPTERPEMVVPRLEFERGEAVIGEFVEEVLNKYKSDGKVHCGRSRDEVWNQEFEGLKRVSEEALRLYRFRVSGEFTIRRNGIYDSKLRDYYYGVWCEGNEGRRVYLRRNPKRYQEAWVFDAKTDEYLGVAVLGYWSTAALANSSLELVKVKEVIQAKKRQKKTLKLLNEQGFKISEAELVRYQASGLANETGGVSEEVAKATVTMLTKMDEVAAKAKRTGTYDISAFGVSDEEMEREREKRKVKYYFLRD